MRISGSPQMRQSEGNRTAKRLSAAWLAQVREWDFLDAGLASPDSVLATAEDGLPWCPHFDGGLFRRVSIVALGVVVASIAAATVPRQRYV